MLQRLIVRAAVPEDRGQWLPLWEGYNAFYGRFGATALPSEVTSVTWERFFDADEPVHALVAEQQGKLLGFAHYLFHRSTIQIPPTCYLQDLFTHGRARRKGIGRALIEAVFERASVAGSPHVYWQTQESNLTAQKLYERLAMRSGFLVYRKRL
jgi:GNAT superfamily N-acetyltransferase